MLLPPLIIEPQQAAEYSVIWLHGLGADGYDFAPIVPHLHLKKPTRFILPHAPSIPVTFNNGYVMPAWYDIVSLSKDAREVDIAGIERSRQTVRDLIAAEEAKGIPSTRIFVVGFSQGGVVALATGLTHASPLAGIIGLSTYLPAFTHWQAQFPTAHSTPIFIAHGDEDAVVALSLGQNISDNLNAYQIAHKWRVYQGLGHSVSPFELNEINDWLNQQMQ